jgi:hypothetical protein
VNNESADSRLSGAAAREHRCSSSARRLLCPVFKESDMIAGVITSKHVLLHSLTIVHDFGVRVWLRSCKAVLTNRKVTFLELMWLA